MTVQNDDSWKDDFLARPEISIAEFNALSAEHKVWLIENKHIFYNLNGEIKNLLHKRNFKLNAKIKSGNS